MAVTADNGICDSLAQHLGAGSTVWDSKKGDAHCAAIGKGALKIRVMTESNTERSLIHHAPPGNGKFGGRPVVSIGAPANTDANTFFAVGGHPRYSSLSRENDAYRVAACVALTRPHSTKEVPRARAAFVSSV